MKMRHENVAPYWTKSCYLLIIKDSKLWHDKNHYDSYGTISLNSCCLQAKSVVRWVTESLLDWPAGRQLDKKEF